MYLSSRGNSRISEAIFIKIFSTMEAEYHEAEFKNQLTIAVLEVAEIRRRSLGAMYGSCLKAVKCLAVEFMMALRKF
jgi:hypothetical protein